MQSSRTIAFAVALAASLTAASAVQWRRNNYATDGFSVEFSGSVKGRPIQLDEATKKLMVRRIGYQQAGEGYLYTVNATLYRPNSTVMPLDWAAKAVMDFVKCAKTESDATSPTTQGKMREIFFSNCLGGGARVGARFFVRGQWLYTVTYIITADDQAADAKHFLTSFKLIPQKS